MCIRDSYIPIEELQDITESMQGNFEGIGVQFQIIKDTIVVISPISGGPSQKKGIQGRVFVQFIIGTGGYVEQIRARGPDPILETEAKRIISLIPKLTPGRVDGKAVRVPFSVPITFRLAGKKTFNN